ncbi:hypothetical protein EZ428_05865 [Pedobacter frigiditerrae]|uniref:Uncharacterized protein n=1 Tax=Pedobacter frigiditerrae TaxID=2530452 RepID=A0A4R0N382_9SPHI|nr:hypothetical protein [Pedobacter frigiditerrae]TCC94301.1 hypothetical protein EZ428_05865 [Pedobacter frigiditerrae]
MIKSSIRQLCYVMLITLTFLSFGTYVLLENFKAKTENVSNDVSEENAESSKETSKELTNSYLFEKALNLAYLNCSSIKEFPLLEIKVSSFSVKPSTPPPDLFES